MAIFSDKTIALTVACLGVFFSWKILTPPQSVTVDDTPVESGPVSFSGLELRCSIALPKPSPHLGKIDGLTYLMLENFAETDGFEWSLQFDDVPSEALDSLSENALDIVITYRDSLGQRELPVSQPVEGEIVWALSPDHASKLDSLNRWLEGFVGDEGYKSLATRYKSYHNPYSAWSKGLHLRRVSPYDELIKQYARKIDWDWRLLASVIYNESAFSIGAESRKGALGLMQILPSENDSVKEMADPEKNIGHGVNYLGKLKRFFTRYDAIPEEESLKFVIAAFNAGEGRIQDCIRFAESQGKDASSWENIAAVIPLMSDEEQIVDTLLVHGKFNGSETLSYVDKVLEVYDLYREICP